MSVIHIELADTGVQLIKIFHANVLKMTGNEKQTVIRGASWWHGELGLLPTETMLLASQCQAVY